MHVDASGCDPNQCGEQQDLAAAIHSAGFMILAVENEDAAAGESAPSMGAGEIGEIEQFVKNIAPRCQLIRARYRHRNGQTSPLPGSAAGDGLLGKPLFAPSRPLLATGRRSLLLFFREEFGDLLAHEFFAVGAVPVQFAVPPVADIAPSVDEVDGGPDGVAPGVPSLEPAVDSDGKEKAALAGLLADALDDLFALGFGSVDADDG
jgi:hypothetical protein